MLDANYHASHGLFYRLVEGTKIVIRAHAGVFLGELVPGGPVGANMVLGKTGSTATS